MRWFLLCTGWLIAGALQAQLCTDINGTAHVGYDPISGATLNKAPNCACGSSPPGCVCGAQGSQTPCATGFRCYPPILGGVQYSPTPAGCDPAAQACGVRASVPVQWPGNSLSPFLLGGGGHATWLDGEGHEVGTCGFAGGEIFGDQGNAWLEIGNFSCGNPNASDFAGAYSLQAVQCTGPCATAAVTMGVDLSLPTLKAVFCVTAPVESCNEAAGAASGAAGESCPFCRPTGGEAGCSVSLLGRLACALFGSGPGALLRYTGGGPGNPGLPGSSGSLPWQAVLGKSWSHDHAERIVIDNATEGIGHVWLITRAASFREFHDLAAGTSGLRLYRSHAPSDEYRKLFYNMDTGGWQLQGLDGSVEHFRADGQWLKTMLPSDPAHPTQGIYDGDGQLKRVTFPDSRSEDYTYESVHGKLHTITENTVTGSPARIWTYGWDNDHLISIQRPDGTTWELTYGTNGAPADGLSQVRLLGTDGVTGRVMAAFSYDAAGRVKDSWRGDPAFTGPNAADRQSFAYTGSPLVNQTVVSQVISAAFTNTTTYTIGRDTVSPKGKVLSMTGNCPTCGLAPNTTFEYNHPGGGNPLLPSAMVDGRSIRTEYTYNSDGRLLTRTEAKGVAGEERTTTWIYDTNFPGLAKEIDSPSTTAGQTRKTLLSYNPATSLPESRTIQGIEAVASFSYTTTTTYNTVGQPLTLDPPGYAAQDVTTFTYNVPGTNGYLPDKKTDPLIGDTVFTYDGLNRRTTMTDVNHVQTVTAYDALNRVTSITRKGDPSAGVADLVTTYFYDLFQDLRCVQLPRGNAVAYAYDTAGRVIEIARKADCNPSSPALERTLYTLDSAGHRVLEERRRDNGGTEVSNSKTEYLYTCHLDKMTQGKGSVTESVTEYCYDEDENLKQVWDANHPRGNPGSPNPATQTYTYDHLNRLTSVSQPWIVGTADTRYAYDVQDHLAQVTDAENNATTYTTSDRDLQTRQVSPVSGTTTYAYNEHGQLTTQTDARNITTARTIDPLDRVTLVHTSDLLTPDVIYTYDAPCAFGKGRLCSIGQGGTSVGYAYDRFGRTMQDGQLSYQYDANGNRLQITYPGGVTAAYTYDFADRQSILSYNAGAGTLPVVTDAQYLALGPLSKLVLANGLTEQHLYDARYFPVAVTVTGSTVLNWSYTVDGVGNIIQIDNGTTPRTYSYVDHLYFLKQGDGPWGTRSWTYDRIGNRLTETRGTTTDTYSYINHNPRLSSIAMGGGTGTKDFLYDPAGNEIRLASPLSLLYQRYDGANRLVDFKDDATGAATYFTYDGRNFLTQARQDLATCCAPVVTQPIYSSEGALQGRAVKNILGNTLSKDTKIFYFAGRPVGLLEMTTVPAMLSYLSVDHLGTPILETNSAGVSLWSGGFEPFGRDWNGAQAAGQFLRFPGQWEDSAWAGPGASYNVYRWYQPGAGRYINPDPIGLAGGINTYSSVWSNPLSWIDPLGLSPKALPAKDRRNRDCTPEEEALCVAMCGEKGVESCKVSQTFRLVRQLGGYGLRKWMDGPMSCSCKDVEGPLERCVRNLRQTLEEMLQWLADHPPHWPPLPLPGPVPVPVPIPGHP
jgi:RHS repeat-associated protein